MSTLTCEVGENAPLACLRPAWMENSHRLVSLWDILNQYNVWQLTAAITQIRDIECKATQIVASGNGDLPLDELERKRIHGAIEYCKIQCQTLELQMSFEHIDGSIRVGLAVGLTYRRLQSELDGLLKIMQSELHYRRFAFVPTARATVLDKVAHEWASIWDQIPASETDSRRAVECYALDQNTACVFHCMRISEHGLRALARKLRIKLTHKGKNQPIEFAEWDKIITEIQNKIAKARTLPKRAAQLSFYSDASDHCLYMKELRNEVSHTRKHYNPGEALGTLQRVHAFMTFLARSLPSRNR